MKIENKTFLTGDGLRQALRGVGMPREDRIGVIKSFEEAEQLGYEPCLRLETRKDDTERIIGYSATVALDNFGEGTNFRVVGGNGNMKTHIIHLNGEKGKEITLPSAFSSTIRQDIVAKVVESKKTRQPYSPSPVGGKQHSASGKIQHVRHVWKTMQGKGISRVPRKIMSRRGSQFNWVGAEIPNAVGGRRAHPPKVVSMINVKRINKKEMIIALKSALAATADEKIVANRYERLKNKKLSGLPIVVESKIISLKTKNLIESLKKVLGDVLFEVALKERSIRSGRGKMRGRKYKKNLGLLLVTGSKEKLKTKLIDVRDVKELNVTDLANGGVGRLTIYTEEAINEMGEQVK